MIDAETKCRIDTIVWDIFDAMREIRFPLDMPGLINRMPHCRYMTYMELAKLNGCSVKDVISACGSYSGCTHYMPLLGQYLITCNHSSSNLSTYARIRWTAAHELGHVLLGHLQQADSGGTDRSFSSTLYKYMEDEAHAFAASLLSPLPFFSIMGIRSEKDVKTKFGISAQAAHYRFLEYKKYFDGSYRKNDAEKGLEHIARLRKIIYPR